MKVLVTGANGFLGRRVVRAFRSRGVEVRALVRPGVDPGACGWPAETELFRADLRYADRLEQAFTGVDALVHLAAAVGGTDETQFASTVVGTERLLDAMSRTMTRSLVLVSSFSVYGFGEIEGVLDEAAPTESDISARDGYAVAKLWQERVARRVAAAHGWDLRVLRPGFIWGPGHLDLAGIGQRIGRFLLVFGSRQRRLPLTHVENCADCVVSVTLDPRAAGQTFNVVDDEGASVWDYAARVYAGANPSIVRLPIPYPLAHAATRLVRGLSRKLFTHGGRLPSLLVPERFEARFKSLRYTNRRLRDVIGWAPPLDYERCWLESGRSDRAGS